MKKEIVLKLKEGKSSALKIIFDQYFEPLVRYSYAYLGDKEAAKDVVQQCFINLWKHRDSLDHRTFESYIFEGSSDPEEKWESDKLEAANSFVFGLNTGIEWRGGPLTFYAEYSSNLSDLYDTTEPGFENFDIKMSTISFGMGVWFR